MELSLTYMFLDNYQKSAKKLKKRSVRNKV